VRGVFFSLSYLKEKEMLFACFMGVFDDDILLLFDKEGDFYNPYFLFFYFPISFNPF
jgi:hypothetical protein